MNDQSIYGQNFVTAAAGLTGISGAATTYSIGTAFNYAIGGKAANKGTAAGAATPTADASSAAAITLTANQARSVVWCVKAGGTVEVFAGPVVPWDGTAFQNPPTFPIIPDTHTPFAYTIHKAGSTTVGTWTFGSSNWNATGMTHAVQDVLTLPSRPQIS